VKNKFLFLFFSLMFVAYISCFNFFSSPSFAPKTTEDLIDFVKNTKYPISIKGAGYSQGNQTSGKHCKQIDLKFLDKITFFDPAEKLITVQAGVLWSTVQEYIDPYNLSVLVMQSYNDFSIGGSLSVNVHGRNMYPSQLIETVESITLLLADGSVKKASREENYELFRSAIGGYGLMGIILDASLRLVENTKIKLNVTKISTKNYKQFFEKEIKNNKNISLYNAKIYPHDFSSIINFTWYKTDEKLIISDRLQKIKPLYIKNIIADTATRRISFLHSLRFSIESNFYYKKNMVVYRNYEMSHSVNELKPFNRFFTTSVLQEYFIPIDNFEKFVVALERIKKIYKINIMNISIRFVAANNESLLAYAPQDCFAFVLYIDILRPIFGSKKAERWTRKLIDAA